MSVSHRWVGRDRVLARDKYQLRAWRPSDGASAYETYFSKREVEDRATFLRAQELLGHDIVAMIHKTRQQASATVPLVQAAIPQEITRLVEEQEIGAGSAANLRSAFTVWVKPALGTKRVDQVATADIGIVIAAIKRANKASVLKAALKPLRSFFRRYAQEHRGFVNPTLDLKDYLGTALRQRRDRERAPRAVFTRDEERKILTALGPFWGLFAAVAFQCGLRWNEIAALAPDDLDLERRRLTVRRGVSHRQIKDRPKTAAGRRDVPIPPVLVGALRTHLAGLPAGAALLFPNQAGRHAHAANFHARWTRALLVAGVTHRGFHTTRHSYATRLRQAGVRVEVLQRWLGHASSQVTMDTYVHVSTEDWADAVRAAEQAGEEAHV